MPRAAGRRPRAFALKLTRAGVLYIALTLLLGFAAVNTGNNLLYLLVSALLGFMAVSGLLGQQNLKRLQLIVHPPRELFAGLPAVAEVELRNEGRWLPVCLIRVLLHDESTLFPLLPARQGERLPLTLRFAARGYHQLPRLQVSSCFPVNFFVRSRFFDSNLQLLVFPRPLPAPLATGAAERRAERRDELQQPGIDGELRSIDSYRDGDPLKAIHWKLSARHEEFKVKRLGRLGAPSTLLDPQRMSGPLEERLGRCTYWINQLSRQQRPVGLQLADYRLPPALGEAHRIRLLRELALYDGR